jgi:hypothetical protein
MMDPRTAVFMAGRVDPHRDRDAQQLAAARAAGSRADTRMRSTVERVQAFFSRTESPSSASCDCTDN